MAKDRNDDPYTWDYKSKDNYQLEHERLQEEQRMRQKTKEFTTEDNVRVAIACIVALFGEVFEQKDSGIVKKAAAQLGALFDYFKIADREDDQKAKMLSTQIQTIEGLAQTLSQLKAAAASHAKLTLDDLCG